jgi:hypothetical protein
MLLLLLLVRPQDQLPHFHAWLLTLGLLLLLCVVAEAHQAVYEAGPSALLRCTLHCHPV